MLTGEPDITRLLMRVERLGLLLRKRDEGDRRVVIAVATKRGLLLLERLNRPLQELQLQQFALLSNHELEVLVSGLEKVLAGMARLPG